MKRIVVLLTVLAAVLTVACGSVSSAESAEFTLQKISDNGRILTIDDVTAMGWKRGKTYDIEGLTGADAAYMGFWTPPGLTSMNYEIRIYASHQDAVEKGTPFAEDAAGANASLGADEAMWAEGVRDRRIIVGGGSRGSQNPRYGNYVILDNLVILCEGRTSEHALDQCAPFVALIKSAGA